MSGKRPKPSRKRKADPKPPPNSQPPPNPQPPPNTHPPSDPPPPPPDDDDDPSTVSKKDKKRAKYQVFKEDLEVHPGIEATRNALYVHICIVLRLANIYDIPVRPSTQTRALVLRNKQKIRDYISGSVAAFTKSTAAFAKQAEKLSKDLGQGHLRDKINRVEQEALREIARNISELGLEAIEVDLSESAESDWNILLERLILRSFRRCFNSGHYRHWAIRDDYIKNDQLMAIIYRHYVFYYLKRRHEYEKRHPGGTERTRQADTRYHRQCALAERRGEDLRERGFSREVQNLFTDPNGVSEDEAIPDMPGHFYALVRPIGILSLRPSSGCWRR
ncbi:hypothetical protein PM082_021970 [Marasmius tenuissimus]|nr:hypothetical protein PM082_021970 [Marasmius tenuissimus]